MTFLELPQELQNEMAGNGIVDVDILRLVRRSNQNGHHITVFTKSGGRFRFRRPNPLNNVGTNWRMDLCNNDEAKTPFNWD